MRSAAVLMLALVLAACDLTGAVPSTQSSAVPTSSASSTSTLPPVVECPGVGEFEEGSGIADIHEGSSDSSSIARITWEVLDQCESFHIDFATSEGAPATTAPEIRVDHLDSFQVVRVRMSVESTVITDQLVETGLVERLYVVRSLSGDMFLDLHLVEPAAVRASVTSSPARLTLDLRPGFVPFAGAAVVAEDIILTSPINRTDLDPNVEFLGYARTANGEVHAEVRQAGELVEETSTTAADYLETWGEYRLLTNLPSGQVSVVLGQPAPDDGPIEGISLDLSVS
jgi:hypothetical protein